MLWFVDLETTGLDPEQHEAWEIAWAFGDEEVSSTFLPHFGARLDAQAMEVNSYLMRCPDWARNVAAEHWPQGGLDARQEAHGVETRLRARVEAERPHVVAASPEGVDIPFLRRRWRATPWHHRAVSINAYAMGILGHDEPKGLWDIIQELNGSFGYTLPLPDHTAAADVEALRRTYHALRQLSAVAWAPQKFIAGDPVERTSEGSW